MIEIIEKGTKHRIRCKDCGCLFSFDDEDVSIRTGITIYGMKLCKKPYGIICPQCKNEIALDIDK